MRFALVRPLVLAAVAACFPLAPSPLETGDAFLRTFSPREYGAFYQNWCSVQDPRGLVYVANNSGVLEYDGVRWRLIRTDRGTLVRTLAVDGRGRVYVGARGEFGYLDADAGGELRFVSLLDRVDLADRTFSDVYGLCVVGDQVYFQTLERLFQLSGGRIRSWKPAGAFVFAGIAGDRLLVQDTERGILVLEGSDLKPLPGGEHLADLRVRAVFPWNSPASGERGQLIATQNRGFFFLDRRGLKPLPMPADAVLKDLPLWHVLPLEDGTLACGTLQGGLLHLSREGRVLDRTSREEGLPSESVKHLARDAQEGLWVALQLGVARLEVPSPLSRFQERRGLPGTVLSIHRFRGLLYVGTDQGLYALSREGRSFQAIPGLKGAVWDCVQWDDRVLAAGSDGVYELKDGKLVPVRRSLGASYSILRSRRDPRRLYIGTQGGLAVCRHEGGRWVDEGVVPDFPAQVRSLYETDDGTLWMGTTAQGVARLSFPAGGRPVLERFGVDRGLPSLNHTYVHWVAGALRVSSHTGIHRFRDGRFEPDPAFAGLFPDGPRWVYALEDDTRGRIWMHSCDEARGLNESGAAVARPDGTYAWDSRPCVRFSGTWIEGILAEREGPVWFGTSEGLVRLDPALPGHYDQPFRALVRRVSLGGGRVLFGGTWPGPPKTPDIPFRDSRLRVEFAAPSFEQEGAARYQVLLEGYDAEWSAWSAEPYKDYTNLPEGSYRFRVRARNAYGTLSAEDGYAFRVLAPWYRAWWARLLYLLAGFAGVAALFRWRTAALHSRNQALEAKVQARTRDLAARNAELEAMDGTVQAINREVTLQPLLEAILHQSLRQFPQAERGAVLIQGEQDGLFRVLATVSSRGPIASAEAQPAIAFEESEILARYTQGSEELDQGVFRVRELHEAPGHARLGGIAPPCALLAMSLVFEGKVAGFLVLESYTDAEAFQDTDVEKLRRFREHAVTALVKARMFDRLEAATAQMREANLQKNQFLGIVAHDLRNPLNGIVLAAQLLEGEDDLEQAGKVARQIQAAGMEMSALIGRLLDIAAIEAGTIKAEPEQVDVSAMARHIVNRHVAHAEEKDIAVEIEAREGLSAWADVKFLKGVMDNLLSNALKFSPRGSRVLLRVEGLPDTVRISVEDQGPGLTPEDRQKLFGRFARLSAQPTGGEKSTGLGLSIVKHMVTAMGGRIWVDSEPGRGAAFRVELPAREPRK